MLGCKMDISNFAVLCRARDPMTGGKLSRNALCFSGDVVNISDR